MNENGGTEVKENDIHISQKEIDEIMQAGEIKYSNPINYGFAKSDGIQFIPGDKHTKENNMGKVTALNFSALAPDFTDETVVLIEGKHITEADKGKILISEQLASANHLSVGDTLTLTHAKLGEADGAYIDEIPVKTAFVQVTVSGIYHLNIEDTSIKPTAGIADNEIYASLDVLDGLHESEAGIYTGEVDFYVTDPVKLESIIRNIQLLQSIDWTTHFIRTNDLGYSKIEGQLSSLGDLVKILLILVSVVSTAFLTLLLTMRMRGRMQEAGILLAAGVSKGQIMAGFLLEVLSVTIIALILSYAVSLCVTGFLGHSLFGALQPNLLNEQTITAGIGDSLQIENYLKLSLIEILLIYFCQLSVIIASTLVSSTMIMRLKPKEILSRQE
ncbi:MAG: FtsX-like permease family protein [Lachnospiraceae bacterium]|nr:FtsX-like permease family protein [Lachnospiraceae bacterium]